MLQPDYNRALVGKLASAIAEIEHNASLFERHNFLARADAIDYIEFPIVHHANLAIERGDEQAHELETLVRRAALLSETLEAVDRDVVDELRQKITRGDDSRAELRRFFSEHLYPAESKAAGPLYDHGDRFVSMLLRTDATTAPRQPLAPEMVFYQPTPARVILQMIDASAMSEHDTFYDLGCGLGNVVLLSALLTGATAVGIDIEPVYCDYARRCADELGLPGARFINEDARYVDYSDGTIFFMYHPFTGHILEAVLDNLSKVSRRIRLCTLGACTGTVRQQRWLEPIGEDACSDDQLALFVSRA